MRAYWTLTRRELTGYLFSITGYVVIAAVTFILGFSFVYLLVNLHNEAVSMPLTELFFITPLFWVILLLSTPIITMRLFALEKFSGTFETLMTAPVSDLQVVLAKFTAGLIFYVVMWLPLLGCFFVVQHYVSVGNSLDAGVVGSTYLGIILLGAVFVSSGCCASALTHTQTVAAVISVVFGVSLFLLALLASRFPAQNDWKSQTLAALSFIEQMHDFARGVVDTRPVVLYLTLTLFFLFLNLRILESRRWK